MANCLIARVKAPLFAVILTVLTPPVGVAQETVDQFRFLSVTIRDQLPTVQEAKDFHNKVKTLDQFVSDWLTSPEHDARVRRYFDDMFGMQKYFFVSIEQLDLIRSSYQVSTPESLAIDADDTHLDFTDDSGTYAAALTAQSYDDMDQLAAALQAAIGSTATTRTYTVTYNETTAKFTIASSDAASLSLLWNSGANAANSIGDALGFDTSGDSTGATSYAADNPLQESFSDDIPADLAALKTNDVYYLPNYAKSSCGSIVSADAWWTDSTISTCDSALSPAGLDISFVDVSANDIHLDFSDSSGGPFTATLAAGSRSPTQLAADLTTAMNATATTHTYTVAFNQSGENYTISTSDSSSFDLLFTSGANSATSIGDKLGMGPADYTGDLSYYGWGPRVMCRDLNANGMQHQDCGCGNEQILCYPRDLKGQAMASIGDEFQHRALHFYKQQGSWTDVFGGDRFFGDRWLYHHYLYQQDILISSREPPQSVFDDLAALSPNARSETAMPEHSYLGYAAGSGPQRSGVVTAPAFLRRFNNFRSRIRAITERLLCKDVDSSLNIDNYATFNNPNFTPGSDVYEHGTKEDCASCHYSLDNFAATILMWGDGSEGIFGNWTFDDKSQLGHVFGVDGTGPRFLMSQYLAQSEFRRCMAKRAFEDFTGAKWDDLDSSSRSSFESAAADGPYATLQTILSSAAVRDLRKPKTSSVTEKIIYEFSFINDNILKAKCTPCHDGPGSASVPGYVDREASFQDAPANRITDGSMPPAHSGIPALTATEQQILLDYLSAH